MLETYDCLKLLFIHFDPCVDATGVLISLVFSALISILWAVEAWSRGSTNLPVLLLLLLSHWCHQHSGHWWLFCLQCWQCLHDLLRYLPWSFPEICWGRWVSVDIPVGFQLLFRTSLQCCCWRGCISGLVIEVFDESDKVGADVLLYGYPQSCMPDPITVTL